jgi:hypothetical protein
MKNDTLLLKNDDDDDSTSISFYTLHKIHKS